MERSFFNVFAWGGICFGSIILAGVLGHIATLVIERLRR